MAERKRSRAFRARRNTVITPGCVCWLCGRGIDVTLTDPYDPEYGTMDHVIPHSKGGSDALHNLRPAHRGCNASRQATDVDKIKIVRNSREW